jgi:hypothetical protein
LGFCFDCTRDAEHGLGVLVRDGRVIAFGKSQITWSGPLPAGPVRIRAMPPGVIEQGPGDRGYARPAEISTHLHTCLDPVHLVRLSLFSSTGGESNYPLLFFFGVAMGKK